MTMSVFKFIYVYMVVGLCAVSLACDDDSKTGKGTDPASLCADLIEKVQDCIPAYEASHQRAVDYSSDGEADCEIRVVLMDDAREHCERDMSDAVSTGEEMREGVNLIVGTPCDELSPALQIWYVDVDCV